MLVRDYKWRVLMVFCFFCALFVVVSFRLFLLQIKQNDFFRILAAQQYELQIKVVPARGVIFDASSIHPLAFNRRVLSAFIVPSGLQKNAPTVLFLKRHYPSVYKRYLKNPEKHFLWLARRMSDREVEIIKSTPNLAIHFLDEFSRYYPYQGAAQLLGLTDIDNVGIAGLELNFNKQLSGEPMVLRLEKDARSGAFYFDRSVTDVGKQGKSLSLTVDRYIQEITFYELQKKIIELKAKSGTAVVLNPDTGAILALASYPVFDPNKKGEAAFEAMKNRAVNECFEPGSVMKAFCALAAFEEQLVSYDEEIDCEGRFALVDGVKVENPTISLLNRLAEKKNILPFHEVVRYSSNVGIAKVAKRLNHKLYDHYCHLGFGKKTGIQLPGERSGFVNHPKQWSRPSLIVMSFGYELMVTVMQLAKAFCIVANGGYDVTLSILQRGNTGKEKRLYSKGAIDQLKNIMEGVAEKHKIPGMRTMGKTGTARCIVDGKYSTQLHQYSFAGIIEKNDYRRVIVTFIKEPEKASLWASETALPLFKSIASRVVACDRLHGRA
jgi:cell division protein FtsI (penicillin-binding protein 3)